MGRDMAPSHSRCTNCRDTESELGDAARVALFFKRIPSLHVENHGKHTDPFAGFTMAGVLAAVRNPTFGLHP